MFGSWLNRVRRRLPRRPSRRPPRDGVPRLEALEGRVLPSVNYGFALGLGGADYDIGYAVTTDADGDVYATGHFEGVVDSILVPESPA